MDQWLAANQTAADAYLAASKQWAAAARQTASEEKPFPPLPKFEIPKVPQLSSGRNQGMPGGCFNAMIAPLIPYAIKGAIWYQGEANAKITEADRYQTLFSTLITDWRTRWGQGDFPFLFVQLANFVPQKTDAWPELREAQTKTLALPKTGMAVRPALRLDEARRKPDSDRV